MKVWNKIEYTPEVFTELIKNIGVKGVQIEEILSYDSLENANIPIYGLIFIGKYFKNISYTPNILQYWDKDLIFSKQILKNIISTQSLIELILNNEDKIDIGPNLKELKTSMREMDPLSRTVSFMNNDSKINYKELNEKIKEEGIDSIYGGENESHSPRR